MRATLGMVACASVLMLTTNAMAQEQPWWTGAPDAPAQAAPQAPAPQAPVPQAAPPEAPPGTAPEAQAPAEPAQAQPPAAPDPPQVSAEMTSQGEWVYTAQYGWTWVPYGSTTTAVGDEPYAYLYTPSFGWRWFVSPWGIGPFHYGAWGWGPSWGPRYWPHGWAGGHYAPYVHGGVVHFAPRAYAPRFGGAVRVAPRYYGGAAHFGGPRMPGGPGFHGGGSVHGGGGFHGGGGGGHHR
jgi:uncharacterized membrane protein YgcG